SSPFDWNSRPYSVCGRIYVTNNNALGSGGYNQNFFYDDRTGDGTDYFKVSLRTAIGPGALVFSRSGHGLYTAANTIPNNTWVDFEFTDTGGATPTQTLYINGAAVSTTVLTGDASGDVIASSIGTGTSSLGNLAGRESDLSVYNRVLSASEATQFHLATDPTNGLIHAWELDDSHVSGTTITDTATVTSGLSVTVSGTAQEEQTLTATPSGAVTGYQWQSFIGGTWTNISGATSSTYLVQEADEGNQLRVHVTSSGGSADSAAPSAVIDISPTLTTPVISGTAQEGQTLSATAAVANDSDATVSYQWQANHGSGFVNIAGATSLSYVVQEADESGTLRIVATSTDTDGSGTSATSTATSAVIDISPTLTTPVISGTAQEGQTLTATAAVANDNDATVSYQWQVNHGSGFINIAGATSLSYVVQEADEGGTLRVVATSADTDGSGTSATSTATSAVIDISPTLTTPVISGTAQEGQTLTATAAVANDNDATVSYQWQVNHGSGFINIAGATSLSYVVQEADEGGTLRVVATSADTDGSGTSATSTATSAVIDISPTLTTPVISGTAQEGQTLTATAA